MCINSLIFVLAAARVACALIMLCGLHRANTYNFTTDWQLHRTGLHPCMAADFLSAACASLMSSSAVNTIAFNGSNVTVSVPHVMMTQVHAACCSHVCLQLPYVSFRSLANYGRCNGHWLDLCNGGFAGLSK